MSETLTITAVGQTYDQALSHALGRARELLGAGYTVTRDPIVRAGERTFVLDDAEADERSAGGVEILVRLRHG